MSLNNKYQDKIATLKRRRDFLDKRVIDYTGKDNSRDRAEASALNFALTVIESDVIKSMDILEEIYKQKESK